MLHSSRLRVSIGGAASSDYVSTVRANGELYLTPTDENRPKLTIPLIFTSVEWTANTNNSRSFTLLQQSGYISFEALTDEDYKAWVSLLRRFCLQDDLSRTYRRIKHLKSTKQGTIHLMKGPEDQLFVGKCIARNQFLTKPEVLANLKAEARFLTTMKHPRVLSLEEYYRDKTNIVMILEYMEGGSLYDQLTKYKKVLTTEEIAKVMQALLEALAFLHVNGVIHRDVKLENVLVATSNDVTDIRLADFDVACTTEKTTNVRVCGTPGYMAPEMFQGRLSPKVDIFAAGMLFYSLVTGSSVITGKGAEEVLAKNKLFHEDSVDFSKLRRIGSTGVELLSKMIAANPANRPSAAEALEHPWFYHLTNQDHLRKVTTSASKTPTIVGLTKGSEENASTIAGVMSTARVRRKLDKRAATVGMKLGAVHSSFIASSTPKNIKVVPIDDMSFKSVSSFVLIKMQQEGGVVKQTEVPQTINEVDEPSKKQISSDDQANLSIHPSLENLSVGDENRGGCAEKNISSLIPLPKKLLPR
eukprot:TRINITY_DN5442_c0_g2_i4.p1 TRINITY_DN5442_c0_g2~~TRINITY_DN5442_c0_g2_i4.p1  ORF type:complete len:529 (-),score=76.26 TRINITY_DN5442_c0_g2_i4:85-1671(-)